MENITQSSTDKVDELYKKYKEHFHNSFLHNMLWKLLVDKTRPLTNAAFTPVIINEYTELGIADKGEKGYSKTGVIFNSDNYDKQVEICEQLNKDIFGIDDKTASIIICSSM